MDRVFESSADASPPSPPSSPSTGYARAGNPQTATPATKPGPWWYHMITEELRGVVVAAGLTPSHTNVGQLLAAIQALAPAASAASETVSGVVELANPAEAQAMADTGRALTPAGLASAFGGANQSLAGPGYQILPGGLIFQWGWTSTISTGSYVDVTLPVSFVTAGYSHQAIGISGSTATSPLTMQFNSVSSIRISNNGNPIAASWFVVGK